MASTLSVPVPKTIGELRQFFLNYSTKINSKTVSFKCFDFVVTYCGVIDQYVVAQIIDVSKTDKDLLLLNHICFNDSRIWTPRSQIFTPNERKFVKSRGLFRNELLAQSSLDTNQIKQIELAIKQYAELVQNATEENKAGLVSPTTTAKSLTLFDTLQDGKNIVSFKGVKEGNHYSGYVVVENVYDLTLKATGVYKGQIKDNMREDDNGEFEVVSRVGSAAPQTHVKKFTGRWKNDVLAAGEASIVYSDMDTYKGEIQVVKDLVVPQGFGTMQFNNTGTSDKLLLVNVCRVWENVASLSRSDRYAAATKGTQLIYANLLNDSGVYVGEACGFSCNQSGFGVISTDNTYLRVRVICVGDIRQGKLNGIGSKSFTGVFTGGRTYCGTFRDDLLSGSGFTYKKEGDSDYSSDIAFFSQSWSVDEPAITGSLVNRNFHEAIKHYETLVSKQLEKFGFLLDIHCKEQFKQHIASASQTQSAPASAAVNEEKAILSEPEKSPTPATKIENASASIDAVYVRAHNKWYLDDSSKIVPLCKTVVQVLEQRKILKSPVSVIDMEASVKEKTQVAEVLGQLETQLSEQVEAFKLLI